MKQILQNIKTGDLTIEDTPPPAMRPGGVRVRTLASLISAGTEKMIIELGQKNLLGMARARPDLVQQVLQKLKKEGAINTYRNVRSKMERPVPLGYSAAGIVEAISEDTSGFQVGDRVAIAGAGYASHAEINFVPKNLVASIPDGVSFESAAYTTVASIAMQGIRLARPQLGESVAVVGLGLIGLITVQLLKANGCRVVGVDLQADKVELARKLGADEGVTSSAYDPVDAVERFSNGRGVDFTIITAATKSNAPVELAGHITRRKGQVIVVGAVGMDVPRTSYYEKELEVKVSMSYGPGRYDPSYEEGGIDYPYDYVRWTEQRNMQSVLELMAQGKLNVDALTSHRYSFDNALDAYQTISSGDDPYVGIILQYDAEKAQSSAINLISKSSHAPKANLSVGFVGAGNYAGLHLLPHLRKNEHVGLTTMVSATGFNAQQKAAMFGFNSCATDIDTVLNDEQIDAIFVATRHATHADFATQALAAGKHVFVEKPLVVSVEQLQTVQEAYERAQLRSPTGLMVGHNRRFAPLITELRKSLTTESVKQMVYRVNAGPIATNTWMHELEHGRGMLIGEMCHFLDLMQFIADERPVRAYAQKASLNRADIADHDNLTIVVTFDGGSTGTLFYTTLGDKAAPKERFEVYGGGVVAMLDDFRKLEVFRHGKRIRRRAFNQNKGQSFMVSETVDSFRRFGSAPIKFQELLSGMQVVFAAQRSLITGEPAEIISHAYVGDTLP